MSDDFKVNDKRGQNQESETPKSVDEKNRESISEIGFANLIISLGTSAMIHLGIIENPVTKQKEKNLASAKQEIELIAMLKEKTTGNLTESEKKVIDQVLKELHLRFVEASKAS